MTRVRSAVACAWSSLWSVAVTALAVHAAAYRTFWPGDPGHSYLGWYEVAVGALSAIAVGALLLLPLRRLARGRRGPARLAGPPLSQSLVRIAPASLAVFVLQESIERSVAAGGLVVASFDAVTWLVALAVAALAASVIHLVRRSFGALVGRVAEPRRAVPATRPGFAVRRARLRRPSPLAERRAMRAPPLCAS